MKDLISVIIPVYNVEKYLNKCLDSIINQTYKNLEIILIDDGSKDKCSKICDEYAKKDKRIIVIHKENEGQSVARNLGLSIAKGKYIGFLDSDDYIKEDMFEILLNNLKDNNADVSICNIIKVYSDKLENMEDYKELEIFTKDDILYNLVSDNITNYIYNKLYKKELWNNITFPIGRIMEDYDVMYLILEKTKKIVCTNKTNYYYLIREGSSINKFNKKTVEDLLYVVNKRYDYLKKKYPKLIDVLNEKRLINIKQYHDNLSFSKERKMYNSIDIIKEYKFYKKNYKKYKNEIIKYKNKKEIVELKLLYLNRNIYYIYNIMKINIKNIIKKG